MVPLDQLPHDEAGFADWSRQELDELYQFIKPPLVLAILDKELQNHADADIRPQILTEQASKELEKVRNKLLPLSQVIYEALFIRDFVDEVKTHPDRYPDLKPYVDEDRCDDLIQELSHEHPNARFKHEWNVSDDVPENLVNLQWVCGLISLPFSLRKRGICCKGWLR